MDSVVNITSANYHNEDWYEFPQPKQIIKLKGYKRKVAIVNGIYKSSPYDHTLNCSLVYIPAPKSTLKKKSFFTKFKMKIHNE